MASTTKQTQPHTSICAMRVTPDQHKTYLKNSKAIIKLMRAHLDSLAEQEQEGAK